MVFRFHENTASNFFSAKPDYSCNRTREFVQLVQDNTKDRVNKFEIAEIISKAYNVSTQFQRFPITEDFTQSLLRELCTYGGEAGIKEVKEVMEDLATGIFSKE